MLADVFENFRNICMNHYGLDMAWYVRAPGLYWDAALKNKEGSTCFFKRFRHFAND